MHLLDVNVWLGLAFQRQTNHDKAVAWFGGNVDQCCFCRITQAGFLRLASNPSVLGPAAVSLADAWRAYDAGMPDGGVVGGGYPHTSVTFGTSWPSAAKLIASQNNANAQVDYEDTGPITWYYIVPWGTNSGVGATDAVAPYRLILDACSDGSTNSSAGYGPWQDSDFTKQHVRDACGWGYGGTDALTTADIVCGNVHRTSVSSDRTPHTVAGCWGIHSTGSGDCSHLANEMSYVMRCLGVAQSVAFANLAPGLNTDGTGSGLAMDQTVNLIVSKAGDSLFSSNNWQGCCYQTASGVSTVCWDVQHDLHQQLFWKLGNSKTNPADAPGTPPRYGELYNYHWRTGGGGTLQQVITGDNHDGDTLSFAPMVINGRPVLFWEYHGN